MKVTESTDTNSQLLVRLRDPKDREAWEEFVSIYRPLIYRVARRQGLQDADALNTSQEVLYKVSKLIFEQESPPAKGRFRRWLTVVARNTAIDSLRRIGPDAATGGTSIQQSLGDLVSENSIQDTITAELKREAFRWAARRIKCDFTETTWLAFWRTMVEGMPCETVAQEIKKSVGAVYTARSRVMQRLKTEVDSFDWENAEKLEDLQS